MVTFNELIWQISPNLLRLAQRHGDSHLISCQTSQVSFLFPKFKVQPASIILHQNHKKKFKYIQIYIIITVVISKFIREFPSIFLIFLHLLSGFNAALFARLSDKLRFYKSPVELGFWVLASSSSSSSWVCVEIGEGGEEKAMKSRNAKVSVKWIPIFSVCFFLIGMVFTNKYVFVARILESFLFLEIDWAAVDFAIDFDLCFFFLQIMGPVGIE